MDLRGLQTFLALGRGERHLLTLGQALEALGLDLAKMDEQVSTTLVTANKAEALGVVEPFNSAGFLLRHWFFLVTSEAA